MVALHPLSLDIHREEIICFSGPSGSGKTTLLNLLGLIEPVQHGTLLFRNQNLRDLSEAEKNSLRRYHIGFVFQRYHLLPVLTAEENVEYFLTRQGIEREERKRLVKDALEAVGLWSHRNKKPWEMSGGQRQRVAVARAIAKRPDVIIADEPTASLDQKTGQEVMQIFTQLHEEQHVAIIMASHDPMVHTYAKRHLVMTDGSILEAN